MPLFRSIFKYGIIISVYMGSFDVVLYALHVSGGILEGDHMGMVLP